MAKTDAVVDLVNGINGTMLTARDMFSAITDILTDDPENGPVRRAVTDVQSALTVVGAKLDQLAMALTDFRGA